MITQKRVLELFDYRDGQLICKTPRKKVNVGDVSGCARSDGYLLVGIDGKTYRAHRVVWLYHHGYFPENDIDHIDRNPQNNRIQNLREVSRSCNVRNTGNRADNQSGVKGVLWDNENHKWLASIGLSGKKRNLGRFKCFIEAVAHRLAAEQSLDWNGCDSSSPAFQYMEKYAKSQEKRNG
jgi:hypothetical protein